MHPRNSSTFWTQQQRQSSADALAGAAPAAAAGGASSSRTEARAAARAGRAAAAHCSQAVGQKAALAEYLGRHRGSVAQLLGTDSSAAAGAAADVDYGPHGTNDSAGGLLISSGRAIASTSAWEEGGSLLSQPPAAPAATPAATAASARRASVTAYLRGSQDLATTITSGVPYIDPAALVTTAQQQGDYGTRASSSSSLGSCEPGSSSSRHAAVKDAIAARVSAAGACCMHACAHTSW